MAFVYITGSAQMHKKETASESEDALPFTLTSMKMYLEPCTDVA